MEELPADKPEPRKLIIPPITELKLTEPDGKMRVYHFSYYQATWTGKVAPDGMIEARYIAICNTVGCQGIYGEGFGYGLAFVDCLRQLYFQGLIK